MKSFPRLRRSDPRLPMTIVGGLLAGLLWTPVLAQTSAFSAEWPRTDFDRALVDLGDILSGGPPRDGIPPIDDPRFLEVAEVHTWLDPREPVIVVEIGGEAKAYPLQILTWHEIVNDELGGVPISVTFCPLCNASFVFEREHGDHLLDFGTTGKLRKSDLVMYDRQTESWWQQFTGQAIVGELAGEVLRTVPVTVVAWEDFRAAHPDGLVLSRETGHHREYGRNPYRGYDSIEDQPFLFQDPVDPRLPPMERVLNVSLGGEHHLFPLSGMRTQPVVNTEISGRPVVVLSRDGTLSVLDAARIVDSRTIPSATAWSRTLADGRVLDFEARGGELVDRQTGTRWNLLGRAEDGPLAGERLEPVDSGVHFAFAWLAFHPDSVIHETGR